MTSANEERIARLIASRMAERKLNQIGLARESEVSDTIIRLIERGKLEGRAPLILAKVSLALGWTPESLNAMKEGGDPTPLQVSDEGHIVLTIEDAERLADFARFIIRLASQLPKHDDG